jgi:hypothetical protein
MVLQNDKRMSRIRMGSWWAGGGLAAVVLGIACSGGIGPCGPQHAGPFLIALVGLACFFVGVLILLIEFFQIAIRRLKTVVPSDTQ